MDEIHLDEPETANQPLQWKISPGVDYDANSDVIGEWTGSEDLRTGYQSLEESDVSVPLYSAKKNHPLSFTEYWGVV